jgi:uncharacterized protein
VDDKRLAAPDRVIDTHIHYGTDKHVASHVTVQSLRTGEPSSVIDFLDEQGAAFGVLWAHDRMVSPPWDSDYEKANRQVGEAVLAFPDRIIGVARVNPLFGEAHTSEIVRRYADEWGCRGLKLFPNFDGYRPDDLAVMGPVLELAAELKLVLNFNSDAAPYDLPSLVAPLIEVAPEVQFVLAHAGGHGHLWEAIVTCRRFPNVVGEMSQMLCHDIKTFVREVGPDRLLYGSDAPYSPPVVELAKCRALGLEPSDLDKVLYSNAHQIWVASA